MKENTWQHWLAQLYELKEMHKSNPRHANYPGSYEDMVIEYKRKMMSLNGGKEYNSYTKEEIEKIVIEYNKGVERDLTNASPL